VFPTGDHDAGETIAEDIDGSAAHVHELVNPEKKEERFGRKTEGTGCGENDDQRGAGHAGSAFAADEKRE